MAKMMLHDQEAREALGCGVAKLAKAVRGTLGPKGLNAIMDRPIGSSACRGSSKSHSL
jgi:chaperonin GroEL